MGRRIFISHKNEKYSNQASQKIFGALVALEHSVFLDKDTLEVGMDWQEEIFAHLIASDVLILIINTDTEKSGWVQREIDTARALGISIMPVVLFGGFEKAKVAFEVFALGTIQLHEYNPMEDDSLKAITDAVERLSLSTISTQTLAWEEWSKRRQPEAPVIEQNPRLQAFTFAKAANLTFYLATGDATELDGYDVLVNTENDYMQMARFFEMNTLSAAIRWKGASFRVDRKLRQDTIQEQLYAQVKNMGIDSFPVGECFVVPTFAGNSDSKLRDLGYVYILHAATVQIERTKRTIKPLPVEASVEVVKNCLDEVQKIEKNQGAIIYNESGKQEATEAYRGMKSILFPVFGAGQGGNSVDDAVRGMLKGFKTYFAKPKNLPLVEIGVCIYNSAHAETIYNIFITEGFEPVKE